MCPLKALPFQKAGVKSIEAVRLIFESDVDIHILESVLDNEFALEKKIG